MRRLTEETWRNLDPWECCGQDRFCGRSCHDLGGCTNGCIVPKLYARLAVYEDAMPLERVQELVRAEKDGRLVVLPCKVGDTVYQIDYMTNREALKFGIPETENLFGSKKYARKHAKYLPLFVRERKMLKTLYSEIGRKVFLTREEADAALKKMEEADNEAD